MRSIDFNQPFHVKPLQISAKTLLPQFSVNRRRQGHGDNLLDITRLGGRHHWCE